MSELLDLEELNLRELDNAGSRTWSFLIAIQPIWDITKDWNNVWGQIFIEQRRQIDLGMGNSDMGERFYPDDKLILLNLVQEGLFSDSVGVAIDRFKLMLRAGDIEDTQIEELLCGVEHDDVLSTFSLRPVLDSQAVLR